MTILVVDDIPLNRKVLRATLEAERNNVVEACDGLEALRTLSQHPIDLIISDILMPNMDGYRFCCEVRKNSKFSALPFIFFTSTYTSIQDEKFAAELGADCFLRKPATAKAILDAVRELTRKGARREEAPVDAPKELELMREYSERLVFKLEERNDELLRQSELMRQSEENLRHLSGRLLYLQDQERRRIARELHDTTAQKLAVLAINLSLLESTAPYHQDDTIKRIVEDCVALTAACSDELSTLSYLLHPPLLEELGLEGAARDFADGFSRRSGLRISVEISPDLGRLAKDVEITLFRILQESLTNIHRHSGSQTANIRLSRDEKYVRLEVEDAGRGMMPKTDSVTAESLPKFGVGIAGMRERLRQFDGKLEIVSNGQGTTVMATLPAERR